MSKNLMTDLSELKTTLNYVRADENALAEVRPSLDIPVFFEVSIYFSIVLGFEVAVVYKTLPDLEVQFQTKFNKVNMMIHSAVASTLGELSGEHIPVLWGKMSPVNHYLCTDECVVEVSTQLQDMKYDCYVLVGRSALPASRVISLQQVSCGEKHCSMKISNFLAFSDYNALLFVFQKYTLLVIFFQVFITAVYRLLSGSQDFIPRGCHQYKSMRNFFHKEDLLW